MYSVSRETVRKALNLLKNAGYIQKKQGKGSIVLDLNRFDFPISGLTSFKELQDTQRIPSETKVVEIRKIAVSPKLHGITDWPVASEHKTRSMITLKMILDLKLPMHKKKLPWIQSIKN